MLGNQQRLEPLVQRHQKLNRIAVRDSNAGHTDEYNLERIDEATPAVLDEDLLVGEPAEQGFLRTGTADRATDVGFAVRPLLVALAPAPALSKTAPELN